MRKKSKKKTQTPNPQGPEYATGSAAPIGQTGGPRGAGECGHHVDTLRHQPHEDAREAASGEAKMDLTLVHSPLQRRKLVDFIW